MATRQATQMQTALHEISLMAQHKEIQRRKLTTHMKICEESKHAFDGQNFYNHFYIKIKMEIYFIFKNHKIQSSKRIK